MPEELAIVVVVLVVACWLLVKMVRAFVDSVDAVWWTWSAALTKGRKNRYLKKKSVLSHFVQVVIPNELGPGEKQLDQTEVQFGQFQNISKWNASPPAWTRAEFKQYTLPNKNESCEAMDAEDIHSILMPGATAWADHESILVGKQCEYPFLPPSNNRAEFRCFPSLTLDLDSADFECDGSKIGEKEIARYFGEERNSVVGYNKRRSDLIAKRDALNERIRKWNEQSRAQWETCRARSEMFLKEETAKFALASDLYLHKCEEQRRHFREILEGYNRGEKKSVIDRVNYVLGSFSLPRSVPHTWDIDFDDEQQILIVEIGLPDVVHRPPFKKVFLKSGPVQKPLNQTERKAIIPQVHPAVLLRFAYEIFRNDDGQIVKLLVLNGWIKFDDPSTGINTKAYTASLMVERSQITGLNLQKIEPLAAFDSLHGKSAGRLVEIIPIEPTLSLNRKDSRFVDAKAVLGMLGSETNLAAMDWQDFEHLIRELFEKEFADRGAEVKITQASRDRGVDAIVFDPDPIHGGKYVIQAKRYTNTVEVSAVRDLCAVVKKEGASRGILVTTSTYGADAYAFANNEPITLLNGAELLGLLKKHGYSFRINLQEARKLNPINLRPERSSTTP